jgi:cyanophycin synthetase
MVTSPFISLIRSAMTITQQRDALTISTRLVYDELLLQSASVRIIDVGSSLLEYQDITGESHYIFSTCSDKSSATGLVIARNKSRTATIAAELGIPIPVSSVCYTFDEALSFMKAVKNIVIKPLDNKGGVGVSTNIHTKTGLKKAFVYARAQSTSVIAQEHLGGVDVRLLVIGGEFVSAVIRKPAQVIGNGRDSIETLIKTENISSTRGNTDVSSLMRIDLDAAKRFLGQRIHDMPDAHATIQVVGPANVSLGGSLIEATHIVTNKMKRDAELITRKLGLGICGVDMIWDRVTDTYGLIEVNAVPGIDIHDDPFSQTSSDATHKYVTWLMN